MKKWHLILIWSIIFLYFLNLFLLYKDVQIIPMTTEQELKNFNILQYLVVVSGETLIQVIIVGVSLIILACLSYLIIETYRAIKGKND